MNKIKKKIIVLNRSFKKPITCLTAYSSSYANILDGKVDIVLIGDSLANTVYGMNNTQKINLEIMKNHGKAVKNFIKKSLTIIDMPYRTYENKYQAYRNGKELLDSTNVDFLKIEVDKLKLPIVKYLSEKGINLVSHIGVTPQSYKNFKDIRIKGKNIKEFKQLIQLAKDCEKFGSKIVLLECVTEKLSNEITSVLKIPTIGIGASAKCDGQVLVTDDIINLTIDNKKPKFVKNYINFKKLLSQSIKKYAYEVKTGKFPNKKNVYN